MPKTRFSYHKLIGLILEVFGSRAAFCKALGITERSLMLKLRGDLDFKQTEIYKSSELLKISKEDIPAYFFEEKV